MARIYTVRRSIEKVRKYLTGIWQAFLDRIVLYQRTQTGWDVFLLNLDNFRYIRKLVSQGPYLFWYGKNATLSLVFIHNILMETYTLILLASKPSIHTGSFLVKHIYSYFTFQFIPSFSFFNKSSFYYCIKSFHNIILDKIRNKERNKEAKKKVNANCRNE